MDKLDLLIKSLDNELSPEEQRALNEALAESEALRREREQLLAMRAAMADLRLEPDAGFPERVLEQIRVNKHAGIAIIADLFPRVAAACIVILFAFLLSVYLSDGSLTTDALLGTQELTVDEAYSLVSDEETIY